jgi:hypothetical protein
MNESTVHVYSKKDDDDATSTEQCFTKTDDEHQRKEISKYIIYSRDRENKY